MTGAPHPLLAYFLAAADGRFPPADGRVTVLPPLPGGLECSVAFTGHAVVATALDARRVADGGADGYGGSLDPRFLLRLAGPDGWIGVTDATLTARATGGPPRLGPLPGLDDHPRVRFARSQRTRVTVHGDGRGLVTLAHGLAGRHELSVELHDTRPDARSDGRGHGRTLLRDALTLLPAGTPVFAAVAPGNARSLRAFLAAGFTPVGGEVVLRPGQARSSGPGTPP
ncbi:hypothetical protein K353_00078 [Kitasatospora sp. SolWspMP-SS2h]|uniref:hypothetical protein n=1 Tax=Kitasatospora sp. SolWspMP-SS2h TaxID=1305729 RepID=UPI000DB99F48|nr:hypothetical protein [Kitasatospora sp. SolWspMP-SS2h]RAJ46877.1 hypothetical protein K353_00078 [Kitasatospora sp. SolWspMP-SS2h]